MNRKILTINYVIMLTQLFFMISIIVGSIMAYIQKSNIGKIKVKTPEEEFLYSHYSGILKTNIIYILGNIIGWILIFTLIGAIIGYPLVVIVWIYYYYSSIVGIIEVNKKT